MAAPERLRFAVLADEERLPAWALESLRRLMASGDAELCLVIRAPEPERERFAELTRSWLPRLYLEHWVERRAAALAAAVDEAELGAVPSVECPSALTALSAADAELLGARALDVVLYFGRRRITGAILEVARRGVWVHCHGRGGALGFWEMLGGEAKTRVTLERLGSSRAGRVELGRGWFGTCKASWVDTTERVLRGSTDFCARACAAELHVAEDAAPFSAALGGPEPESEARPITTLDLLRWVPKAALHGARKSVELLFHHEIWNVAFTTDSVETIIRNARVRGETLRWCKPHARGQFIADPFALNEDGEERILVEDYDPKTRGRICRVRSNRGGRVELEPDLEQPFHLSYPHVFVDAGATYCVPEAYQSRQVSLYRRVDGKWQLERALIEGLPIVDPTLFKHDGRYWLLFTLQDDGAYGSVKLYAYHSEQLQGPYEPHRLNPVKTDVGSSRPAGAVIELDGALYRPSQDCSVTYGGAVVVHRILQLTPTAFEEVEVARLEPVKDGPFPAGLHTLNITKDGAVIDSKRFAFDPLAWRVNRCRMHEVFV